jgi:hypothetical protein
MRYAAGAQASLSVICPVTTSAIVNERHNGGPQLRQILFHDGPHDREIHTEIVVDQFVSRNPAICFHGISG